MTVVVDGVEGFYNTGQTIKQDLQSGGELLVDKVIDWFGN